MDFRCQWSQSSGKLSSLLIDLDAVLKLIMYHLLIAQKSSMRFTVCLVQNQKVDPDCLAISNKFFIEHNIINILYYQELHPKSTP